MIDAISDNILQNPSSEDLRSRDALFGDNVQDGTFPG